MIEFPFTEMVRRALDERERAGSYDMFDLPDGGLVVVARLLPVLTSVMKSRRYLPLEDEPNSNRVLRHLATALEAKNSELEAKNSELEAKNSELEAKNDQQAVMIKNLLDEKDLQARTIQRKDRELSFERSAHAKTRSKLAGDSAAAGATVLRQARELRRLRESEKKLSDRVSQLSALVGNKDHALEDALSKLDLAEREIEKRVKLPELADLPTHEFQTERERSAYLGAWNTRLMSEIAAMKREERGRGIERSSMHRILRERMPAIEREASRFWSLPLREIDNLRSENMELNRKLDAAGRRSATLSKALFEVLVLGDMPDHYSEAEKRAYVRGRLELEVVDAGEVTDEMIEEILVPI